MSQVLKDFESLHSTNGHLRVHQLRVRASVALDLSEQISELLIFYYLLLQQEFPLPLLYSGACTVSPCSVRCCCFQALLMAKLLLYVLILLCFSV